MRLNVLLQLVKFDIKRFFRNSRAVAIFLIGPLVIITFANLMAFQESKNIKLGIVDKSQNEFTTNLKSQIASVKQIIPVPLEDESQAESYFKQDNITALVILDIQNGEGIISIIDDPRYPGIQAVVREKIPDAVKLTLSENIKDSAQGKAQAEFIEKIDQRFVSFRETLDQSPAEISDIPTLKYKIDKIEKDLDATRVDVDKTLDLDSKFSGMSSAISSIGLSELQVNALNQKIVELKDSISSDVENLKAKQNASKNVFTSFKKDISETSINVSDLKSVNAQIDDFNSQLKNEKIQLSIKTQPVEIEMKENTPGKLKYFDRYNPGVIPLIIVLICLTRAATSLAVDKEEGMIERMFTAPFTKGEIIISKLISNIIPGIIGVSLIIIASKFVFLNTMGNMGLIALVSFLTALTAVSLGLLISAFTNDLASSVQFSFYTFFVLFITSEFLFEQTNTLDQLKFLTKLNFLTYSIAALRKINLFGWGFSEVRTEILAIAAFAVVLSIAAIFVLHRKEA